MANAVYSDLSALSNYGNFVNNIAYAVSHYANYLVGQGANTTIAKYNWAVAIIKSGGMVGLANAIASSVAQDGIFTGQLAGTSAANMLAAVTDAQLQAAVEAVINKILAF